VTSDINIIFFLLIGLAVLGTSIYAVTASKLLNAALALALSFFAIGGLYFLLGTPFLGMLQILINAGAIPIVTVFILFMTQSRQVRLKSPLNAVTAFIAFVPLALALGAYLFRSFNLGAGSTTVTAVSPAKIGEHLLSSPETTGINGTLLSFEVASVILLVAMVGAIVLTKRDGETIKGDVGVLSEVDKSVRDGELLPPAMTYERETQIEREKDLVNG
jgi:NADH-quinone oxidoreductase subunit J